MRKLLFVNDGSTAPIKMWIESADFWGIAYEIVDPDTFQQLDLNRYELVLAVDQSALSAPCFSKLDAYIQNGGNLLISGNLPDAFSGYFGGIRVKQVMRHQTHRCVRMAKNNKLGSWKDGEILFFTNSYNCSGKDYVIDTFSGLRANLLGDSYEMDIVNSDLEQWGEWNESAEPSIIESRVGSGKVMYIPLCLGEMEWVVQPRIPTFTEFPYVIKNNGIAILMKDIYAYMAGSEQFAYKPLWPGGAQCVVVLSGDVHDYEGIPGRANREYRDMIDNANVLREYGLDGKATFFITGAVATKFPDEIIEVLGRGYEICPHTHQDTCYSNAGWDYQKQKADICRCVASFRNIAPEVDDYCKGFRTHGYNSNYDTRLALENLGYEYLADLQGWEAVGKYNHGFPDNLVTYVTLPQHALDYRGRKLNLLEIPDTVANDHFVYRVKQMNAETALDFFKEGFDRMYRLGGLFQTCLHPYVSLKEGPGREEAYRELIQYMASHKNVVFMRMKDLSRWWNERETVKGE